MNSRWSGLIAFIRSKNLFNTDDFIPLHAPIFRGNEKKYLIDCIDSTFVSSVGKFVDRFEQSCAEFTGCKYSIATMNGTAALYTALKLSDVCEQDEVITQPVTFVATANAISYTGAKPLFIDVDRDTMGLSPEALEAFLKQNAKITNGQCRNVNTGCVIRAIVPVHTFGHPAKIAELKTISDRYNITLIEDAAESLGSYYNGKHTGTFGGLGVLSFNGNKTITCGGGGMIITNDKSLAERAKHITTTAKVPHKWEYIHDTVGFNYRLTNLNAAVGCAQLEQLENILEAKRRMANEYKRFCDINDDLSYVGEPKGCQSNFWLNTILLNSKEDRDSFLEDTNKAGVMTRPMWRLMNKLEMYGKCQAGPLTNAEWLSDRIVNVPSGAL